MNGICASSHFPGDVHVLICSVFGHYSCLPRQLPPKTHTSQSSSPSEKALPASKPLLPAAWWTPLSIVCRHLRFTISQPKPVLLLGILQLNLSLLGQLPDLPKPFSGPPPGFPPLCGHILVVAAITALLFVYRLLSCPWTRGQSFVFLPPVARPALGTW